MRTHARADNGPRTRLECIKTRSHIQVYLNTYTHRYKHTHTRADDRRRKRSKHKQKRRSLLLESQSQQKRPYIDTHMKTHMQMVAEEKARIMRNRSFKQRFFSWKTFHGIVMFTSWINIAGRIPVSNQTGNFTCHTYPVWKKLNSTYSGNHLEDGGTLLPIHDPKYNRYVCMYVFVCVVSTLERCLLVIFKCTTDVSVCVRLCICMCVRLRMCICMCLWLGQLHLRTRSTRIILWPQKVKNKPSLSFLYWCLNPSVVSVLLKCVCVCVCVCVRITCT
jgi:hypothetical protein